MDQNSKLFQDAKQLLNDNDNTYTDAEIREILALLDSFTNIIYHNLTRNS